MRKLLSPTYFALIAISFVLPFATVSCDGAETSFTGVQLITWTVPDGGTVNEGTDCDGEISDCIEARGSVMAAIALLAALIAVALGIAGEAKGSGWCAGVGLVAMLWIAGEAVTTMADVEFRVGYWLPLLLFFCATVVHAARSIRRWRRRRRELRHRLEAG
jgi:hypothetical protein